MSISNIIKLTFTATLFLVLPYSGEAKVFKFEDKSWDIPVTSTYVNNSPLIRSANLAVDTQYSILGTRPATIQSVALSDDSIEKLLPVIEEVNRETKSAKLVIENNTVEEFEPGQDGQAVDVFELARQALATETITLPVLVSYPQTRLADTNNLGITELVAVGESDFKGSPNNRLVNIRVGSGKFQNLIIKPGEEFSFNKFLGDVDAENGFLPELVIKRNGLVPEFGGGLCQVSSTVFRAAMNAGLPITERRNHSFAVQYYAPQGTDATIYPGVVDLKFINDLPGHLLIRPRIEGNKLYFDFYGTKDNRQVSFDGPTQYDKKPDGAMKAIWTRRVSINGETKEQVFRSNYVSPALFPRQTSVEASTPNPQAQTPPSTETTQPTTN